MIPLEKVKNIVDKHSKLETDLSSNSIDKKKFAEMSKEYSDLNEIIEDAKFYILFEIEKKELEKIINDKSSDDEMIDLANAELSQLINKNEKVKKKLIFFFSKKNKSIAAKGRTPFCQPPTNSSRTRRPPKDAGGPIKGGWTPETKPEIDSELGE